MELLQKKANLELDEAVQLQATDQVVARIALAGVANKIERKRASRLKKAVRKMKNRAEQI